MWRKLANWSSDVLRLGARVLGPNGAAQPSWAPDEAVQLELAPSDGTKF